MSEFETLRSKKHMSFLDSHFGVHVDDAGPKFIRFDQNNNGLVRFAAIFIH